MGHRLGYDPLPETKTLAEQLVRHRTTLGLSHKEAAVEVGVDPSIIAAQCGHTVNVGTSLYNKVGIQ